MKKVLGVILGGLLLLPVVSNAADAQKAADNKKPVNSWTCEDFLAVDESFQPTAV
ncbi:acid-activated periplasmic chaperone HdeA, partial [Shewanella sp. AS16]|nr:acid-activated periplasmic chaperone HdeA [Shewanella sp. AS16]